MRRKACLGKRQRPPKAQQLELRQAYATEALSENVKKLFKNWGTERKGGHQKIFFLSKKITLTGSKLNPLRYSRVNIFIESFLDYQPICC